MKTNTNEYNANESNATLLQEAMLYDSNYRGKYVHIPGVAKNFLESSNPDKDIDLLIKTIKLGSADVLHYFLDESSTQVRINPIISGLLKEIRKKTDNVLH